MIFDWPLVTNHWPLIGRGVLWLTKLKHQHQLRIARRGLSASVPVAETARDSAAAAGGDLGPAVRLVRVDANSSGARRFANSAPKKSPISTTRITVCSANLWQRAARSCRAV